MNSGAFAVVFSAVVAIATFVYAILTWKLVAETRKMREVQTEPKISIIIQSREEWINYLDMIIQNIGLGPAYNIRFEIMRDFEYLDGRVLSELNIIKNGLKYLAPKQRIQFFLTNAIEKVKEKIETNFEIKVSYNNSMGKSYEDIYTIDLSELFGLLQLGAPPLFEIAENTKNIASSIKIIQDIVKNIEHIQKSIDRLSNKLHR